jgi:DHA1 family bicyclomycin/chloramphenicol resistance-like MFS transporter
MAGVAVISAPYFLLAQYYQGHPPLAMLMTYLLVIFFFFGIMFGNLNALAMEPLGRIAGLGSAVVGSVSTLMSVMLGVIVANAYDGTILPLVAGFSVLSVCGLIAMFWTEKFSRDALRTT